MATPKLLAYGIVDTDSATVVYEVPSSVAAELHQFIIFSQYLYTFSYKVNLQAYLNGAWQTYCSWVTQDMKPGETRYVFLGRLQMSPSTRIVIHPQYANALSYTITGTEEATF